MLVFESKNSYFVTMSKEFIHFPEFDNLVLLSENYPVYGVRSWIERTISNPYVISKVDYTDFMVPPTLKRLDEMKVSFSETSLSGMYLIVFSSPDDTTIVKLALSNLSNSELEELMQIEN